MSQQRATVQRTGGTTATIPIAVALQREVDAALASGIPARLVAEAKASTPYDARPEHFADTLNSIMARELKARARVTSNDDDDDDEKECPSCHAMNDEDALKCDQCGADLEPEADDDGDAAQKAGLAKLGAQFAPSDRAASCPAVATPEHVNVQPVTLSRETPRDRMVKRSGIRSDIASHLSNEALATIALLRP
jgi:hypothetical protein